MKKLLISTFLIGSFLSFPVSQIEAKSKTTNISPSALCKDGTYSYSKTRKGTCSHHKGVKVWYKTLK
jgi:hypothetical protein